MTSEDEIKVGGNTPKLRLSTIKTSMEKLERELGTLGN
jgi:hypothetical protein